MAHVNQQDRSAPGKRARTRTRVVVRSGAAKARALKTGADVTEVSVSKARFERIAVNLRTAGKVLSGYADVAAEAQKTGRSFTIAFRVSPDGEAVPMAEAVTAADPLDAALEAARVRGAAKVKDILKDKDMLTARAFAPLIGASHETVNLKRKTGEVLGLEGATRGVRYPRWQVTDAGLPLPGLHSLFDALGKQPWTVYRFLRTAHAELGGRTALEALKAGRVEAVVGVAENQAAGAFA